MIQKTLYTGNGVSLSPVWAEGRTESHYVRLIADDGMAITNGETVTVCVDVLAEDAHKWEDCEMPPEDTDGNPTMEDRVETLETDVAETKETLDTILFGGPDTTTGGT